MARVQPSEVKEIFDTELSNTAVQQWIEIANTLVDRISDRDSSITSTTLTQIEKLAACHLAATQDPRLEQASAETRSATYQGETGMGWESTIYGQQALALDPTNVLANSTKPSADAVVVDAKGIE